MYPPAQENIPYSEFHVSRKARDRYQFDLNMFSIAGTVIFANFHAARLFAQKINEKRDLLNNPEEAVNAADINAMGLIHEILHIVIEQYRLQHGRTVFQQALDWLEISIGRDATSELIDVFMDDFPPVDVYLGKTTKAAFLAGSTNETPNREQVLEEILLLWLTNRNPAFESLSELFDDSNLRVRTQYSKAMLELETFFDGQPRFGPPGSIAPRKNLMRLLQEPAVNAPESLISQLQYLRNNWGNYLDQILLIKHNQIASEPFYKKWGIAPKHDSNYLLSAIDFIAEEHKDRGNWDYEPPPAAVLEFDDTEEEVEQFSTDLHWMPRLVLMAKSTLVWLDQLAKQYEREVTRLDQIPSEELDLLAERGFTGLWLIGLWERSDASKTIKNWCGNPEAESSAYSLYDYTIAENLGGDEAYEKLRERCWKRGIRLASDMVPNHTGVDSAWVREFPERYIQLPYAPFPAYAFSGQSLCPDPNVGIYVEDHYFDQSDAAVVFKHVDHRNGATRYIYHGNDGTSFPWNDTAQLDYTREDVREAVIQVIVEVAKKFPIIRFDAAMTLAKKHFQRLWFPEPGSGGDIPSRAEHGLTKRQFDALVPVEFWRDVVDRIADEAPDTLLLAEAFWMMEGYFVRTLGMHRVYNSAFMNMLHKEENQKYRDTIKNTVEFDPEILKRYVNFMNNPDEETAIRQFGDGDKYFAVCTMMATMPGLPMFGHGQVEGFEEKYGMEYRKAYMDERPKPHVVDRHYHKIFPLLKRRYLFAEIEHFLLYDFYRTDETVNEDVYAYSNRYENERALVIVHNAHDYATGRIHVSAAYSEKRADGSKRLKQRSLGEGLNIPMAANTYFTMRNISSGLTYIYHARTVYDHGLEFELGPYAHRVFTDFEVLSDDESQQYANLTAYLNGRGVPDIHDALQEVYLKPIHESVRQLLNVETLGELINLREVATGRKKLAKAKKSADPTDQQTDGKRPSRKITQEILKKIEARYTSFIETALDFESIDQNATKLSKKITKPLSRALRFKSVVPTRDNAKKFPSAYRPAMIWLRDELAEPNVSAIIIIWALMHRLGDIVPENGGIDDIDSPKRGRYWLRTWVLGKLILMECKNLGFSEKEAAEAVELIEFMIVYQDWRLDRTSKTPGAADLLESLLQEKCFQKYLKINRFEDTLWFNKERFEQALNWMFIIHAFNAGESESATDREPDKKKSARKKKALTKSEARAKSICDAYLLLNKWRKAAKKSEYKVDTLLANVGPKPRDTKKS